MVFVTIAASNYLEKAQYLAQTVRLHHPEATLVLCLSERSKERDTSYEWFDLVLGAEDIGLPSLNHLAFVSTILEFSTAIKARVLQHTMDTFPAENRFVYLDPDIAIFGRLDEVETALEGASILLTPHHLVDSRSAVHMLPMLKCGVFNLGFLALKRGQSAAEFLSWWAAKLERYCFVDFNRGLFVDQKWVDLAPSLFDVTIFKEPGYNVAYWNVGDRPIECRNGTLTAGGKPLKCLHFSGVDVGKDQGFLLKGAPPGSPIHRLREEYKVRTMSTPGTHGWTWSYDLYDSGERVSHELRVACRARPPVFEKCSDPFKESNEFFYRQLA